MQVGASWGDGVRTHPNKRHPASTRPGRAGEHVRTCVCVRERAMLAICDIDCGWGERGGRGGGRPTLSSLDNAIEPKRDAAGPSRWNYDISFAKRGVAEHGVHDDAGLPRVQRVPSAGGARAVGVGVEVVEGIVRLVRRTTQPDVLRI